MLKGTRPTDPVEKRPKCQTCGDRLKPTFVHEYVREEHPTGFHLDRRYTGKVRHYGYDQHGLFCSLRCGYAYAIATLKRK